MKDHRYCVIMCGGTGSRLWPCSRKEKPKQFLDLLGTGRTLLQMTYDRLLPLVGDPSHIFLATYSGYAPLVEAQLPQVPRANVLCEPARRNTTPTVTWAAYHLQAVDPGAVLLMSPSDQLITGEREFAAAVEAGWEFAAANDALLTVGVRPTGPETRYGYIQAGKVAQPGADGRPPVCKVKTFTEKPPRDLAQVFVDTGEFYWNAGIFMWRASSLIKAMRECDPDLTDLFDRGLGHYGTPAERDFIQANFPACPASTIDYTVMERAGNVYVEPAPFGWSDLGTWNALWECTPGRDGADNAVQGPELIAYGSSGNIVTGPRGKLVVLDGLDDFIVADAGDVLLVCPRSRQGNIKQVVNDVRLRRNDNIKREP